MELSRAASLALGRDIGAGDGCETFLPVNLGYPGLRCVHSDPPIYSVDAFLTPEARRSAARDGGAPSQQPPPGGGASVSPLGRPPAPFPLTRHPALRQECQVLIDASDGRLMDAHVVGRGDGLTNSFGYRQGKTPGRTSRTCTLAKEEVAFLLAKAEALLSLPRSHMELPQVGCYLAGQLYAPHFDAVEAAAPAGRLFLANGGQRVATLLVYLNSPQRGGCTAFPALGLRFVPKQGALLLFFPATAAGRLDPRALHTAEPAIDCKWVSQIWVRQSSERRDAEPSRRVGAPAASAGRLQAAPAEDGGSSGEEESEVPVSPLAAVRISDEVPAPGEEHGGLGWAARRLAARLRK